MNFLQECELPAGLPFFFFLLAITDGHCLDPFIKEGLQIHDILILSFFHYLLILKRNSLHQLCNYLTLGFLKKKRQKSVWVFFPLHLPVSKVMSQFLLSLKGDQQVILFFPVITILWI